MKQNKQIKDTLVSIRAAQDYFNKHVTKDPNIDNDYPLSRLAKMIDDMFDIVYEQAMQIPEGNSKHNKTSGFTVIEEI